MLRSILLQIAPLRRIRNALADRPEDTPPSLLRPTRARPLASAQTLRRARRRVQNLLMQVRRRIARDADVLDLFNRNSRHLQTVSDCLRRKSRAVLAPIEALLLDGGQQLTVTHDGRRSIPVICINT